MSLEAILHRVKAIEHQRMKRWIIYTAVLWLTLWMLHWGLNLHYPRRLRRWKSKRKSLRLLPSFIP